MKIHKTHELAKTLWFPSVNHAIKLVGWNWICKAMQLCGPPPLLRHTSATLRRQFIIHAGISKNIFHVEKQVRKATDTSTWHVHDRWSRNANIYLSLGRLFSGAVRWEWTRRVRAARSRCAARALLPPNRSHGTGPASPGRRFWSAEDPSSCSPGRSCYSG